MFVLKFKFTCYFILYFVANSTTRKIELILDGDKGAPFRERYMVNCCNCNGASAQQSANAIA